MQQRLDIFAVSISGLCAIHCLLTPLALTLFPVLSGTLLAGEEFHFLLLWVILPSSSLALWLGWRKHKDWQVLAIGLTGLSLLLIAVFFAHHWAEWSEQLMTILGSIVMAISHIRNYRLCGNGQCSS